MTKLVLALSLLVASGPAFAQVTSVANNNPAPNSHDPNRIICEVEQTTGSRLGAHKVCKTAFEWQQLKAEQRATLEKVQQQATSTGTPSG